MTFTAIEMIWMFVIALLWGIVIGAWMADRRWRNKANGPMAMSSGGRLYQVLTSDEYWRLINAAR